ncbi:MAG: nuclear transport factor 2 family protein [Bacteroidetes bacterium]|nr:nuclear transport factor 2 family protein [Bacteroidota bacterium]MDA0875087.1 nuclear transport factor 2 family protein [Bacteroidota bacterium]
MRFSTQWNAGNRQGIDENTPKEIQVIEVLDKTAIGKLTAVWGIDYFQLEKNDGVWQIRHVIWQSHPPSDG